MKIAVAGYNGFIGRQLLEGRSQDEVIRIPRTLLYGKTEDLAEALSGADVVLNLAGSSINTRWTRKNKQKIMESRNGVNRRLVGAINSLEQKPGQFITASAIGVYANREMHDEESTRKATHFLAKVVTEWERPLEELDPDVKSAVLRIGIVLGTEGGALPKLMMTARWGFVPVLGSGTQMYSFIHEKDLIAAIDLILSGRLEGIFNLCSPNPVDNATFAQSLAKASGMKRIFRIPSLLLRAGLGEAHIMVTEGPGVVPARLLREGFIFRFPEIDEALEHLLQQH